MDAQYIDPFVEMVHELFSGMLSCETDVGDAALTRQVEAQREIVAMIGISGQGRGAVALSMSRGTALSTVGRFIGMEVDRMDEDVTDAVAELVNIIAGGAKAKLCSTGAPLELSLPNVVHGEKCNICYPSSSDCCDVSFRSELGPFNLRLTFQFGENKEEGKS